MHRRAAWVVLSRWLIPIIVLGGTGCRAASDTPGAGDPLRPTATAPTPRDAADPCEENRRLVPISPPGPSTVSDAAALTGFGATWNDWVASHRPGVQLACRELHEDSPEVDRYFFGPTLNRGADDLEYKFSIIAPRPGSVLFMKILFVNLPGSRLSREGPVEPRASHHLSGGDTGSSWPVATRCPIQAHIRGLRRLERGRMPGATVRERDAGRHHSSRPSRDPDLLERGRVSVAPWNGRLRGHHDDGAWPQARHLLYRRHLTRLTD
jgi:hypothetical protein